jgi:hypothetical protein
MKNRKTWKIIGLSLLVLIVVIQFIQPKRNEQAGPFPHHISTVVAMPDSVAGLLKVSCYDCHSNNTKYPWYFHIQPVAWYLADHIDEGKHELNFDEFGTYSNKKQRHKLEKIGDEVDEKEMPLSTYTLIHGDAKLNEAQRKMIVDWAAQALAGLPISNVPEGTSESH